MNRVDYFGLELLLSGKSQMMPVALAARLATNVSNAI